MNNLELQILKFMDAMNLKLYLDISRTYIREGLPHYCVHILVCDKDTKICEYDQYHCYKKTNDGKIIYDQGNEVKGVSDGALAYIGDHKGVDNYFDQKAREYITFN